MTVLVLIRHGLTSVTGTKLTGWAPGFHLSDAGRAKVLGLNAARLFGFEVRG